MRRRILFIASMLLLICSAMAEPTGVAPTNIGGVYQVASWENLLWISQDQGRWGNDYAQTADITFPADMNTWNDGAGWAPIGIHYTSGYDNPPDIPFTGTYNGQNFSINNLYINRPTGSPGYEPVGLFGFIDSGATLENIRLTNISVLGGERNVGALVGYNNTGNIINCHMIGGGEPAKSGDGVSESWGVVALIVTDKNNKNGYEVEAGYNLGGLAGRNKGLIDGSSSSVNVRGGGHAGGLVGVNQGIIRNSNASGSVRDQDVNSWVYGGLVGRNTGSIENSYAAGNVTGGGHIGGLVGQNFGDITLCYATGEVVQFGLQYDSSTTGGLVGRNAYEPSSNNQGLGTINQSHATGNVSGVENTGGLVGRNEYTVNESYATGHVIGTRNVGGLVGNNKGIIENTYAWGKVSVTPDTNNENYGGLVGRNGELVKKSSITIMNSYSTGEIPLSSSGATNIGGLVGNNEGGAIADCFWNTDTAGDTGVGYEDDGGAEGKDTDEMQDITTFSDVWEISPRPDIEKNYPILKYEMDENGVKNSGVWLIGTGEGEPAAVPLSNVALYLSILLIGLFSLFKLMQR